MRFPPALPSPWQKEAVKLENLAWGCRERAWSRMVLGYRRPPEKKVPGRLRENFMCFHISQHCSESYRPEPSLLCPSSHYCQICSLTSPSFSQHGGEGVSAALLSALKRKIKEVIVWPISTPSFLKSTVLRQASVTTVSLTQLIYKDCQVIRLLDFLRLQKEAGSPRWAHVS